MPRSVALFEAQGLQVVPLPTDYNVTQNGWEEMLHPTLEAFVISLVPTGANLAATTSALHEYIGMAGVCPAGVDGVVGPHLFCPLDAFTIDSEISL